MRGRGDYRGLLDRFFFLLSFFFLSFKDSTNIREITRRFGHFGLFFGQESSQSDNVCVDILLAHARTAVRCHCEIFFFLFRIQKYRIAG